MRDLKWLAPCAAALAVAACAPPPSSTEARPAETKPATVQATGRQLSPEDLGLPVPPGVNVKIHRRGGGTPDPTGWYPASSTEGGFSVCLPAPFADFTTTTMAEDGGQCQGHILGTRDERGIKFTAVAMTRPDGKFKGDPLTGLADKFERSGELTRKKDVSLDGMPGIELRVANQRSAATFRCYQAKTALYQLIVEAPTSVRRADFAADEKKFLDSFALEGGAKD